LAGLALAIIGLAASQYPKVSVQLYHHLARLLLKELGWAELVLLVDAQDRLSELHPDKLTNINNIICEQYKGTICHFVESILGDKLAVLYGIMGDAQNRDSWLRRA